MVWAKLVLFSIFVFALGGVPFGKILAKAKGMNLSQIGSGNIGTTNVYRALGIRYAVLVFLLDSLKGVISVLIGRMIFGYGIEAGICGLVSVLGHIFSPYLGFRGGKGVATGFGVMLILAWVPSLLSLGIWIALVGIFRIASLASIISALFLPILVYIFKYENWLVYFTIALVLVVIFSHYSNLKRLFQGKEKQIKRIPQKNG